MARKKKLRLKKKNKSGASTTLADAARGVATTTMSPSSGRFTNALSNTSRLAIPPQAIATGISAAGGIADSIFGGDQVADVDVGGAVTDINKSFNQAQDELDAPMNVYGASRGTSGGTRMESAEDALAVFYQNKGFSPEEAAAKAAQKAKQVASSGKKLKDIKGFKKFLKKEGSDYGFKVKGGKIKYNAGDFEAGGPRDVLTDDQVSFSDEMLDASRGLLPAFTQDAQSGLDFKQRIRDILGSQALDEGMDSLVEADMEDLQDASKNINRQVFGELQDTGFLSSSIAGRAFGDASTKGLRSNLLQMQKNRNNLRSQNIRDMLSSATALSGPSTIGQFQSGGYVNPNQYGGVSDAQAANLAQNEAKMRADIEQNRGGQLADARLTPSYS